MLDSRVVEKVLVELGEGRRVGLLVRGLAFEHAPELFGAIFEHGGQLGLKLHLTAGACGFVCAPGLLGGWSAPALLCAGGAEGAARPSTIVRKPRRQGFVPLVGVGGAVEGRLGNHPRRLGLVQEKLFHSLSPQSIIVQGPLRVLRGLRGNVLVEVYQQAEALKELWALGVGVPFVGAERVVLS